jgi:ABC-2 type transport system permease protein
MVGELIFGLISFFVILFSGFLLFGFNSGIQPDIPVAIISILLTMLAMTSFGFILAGLCFLAKREEEITQVLWPMMTFFSGLAFPVDVLPDWGKIISQAIPLTWGVDATRRALLLGAGVSDSSLLTSLGLLCLLTVILFPLGALFFSKLEKAARKAGTLGTY